MSRPSVQFWFELASTYTYVAAMRAEEEALQAGVALIWKPFLLGPLFQRQGWNDSPFNLNPVRGRYMWRDVARLCDKHNLPFKRPSQFPRNSLLAARVACAAEGRACLPEFVRAIYRANFAEDRDISDERILGDVLRSMGEDAEAWLARARSPEIKDRLRKETDAAWELGIFGSPSFVAEGEVFWGGDRMEDAFAWHHRGSR
ncbi:MAG TPA: 2-hydroxychromene-2-carboxylate isomerase [Candidatus Polarisedimenticolia bacterium]|jgi:2-hydroxychromene-2-carboxylate isomerase|nr:2-hydroxychromene-2-carboxylate isomerase [Candidatus Polarisedimenticolia bacterium]